MGGQVKNTVIQYDYLVFLLRVANAARKLDRSDANLLREIGQFMARKGEFTQAATIFQRINDIRAIVQMHVQSEHWEDVRSFCQF